MAASHMLSRNPANVIRVGDHKGLLAEGYDADFVILDKENLEVQQTWISGKEYYNINK
ncbi:MAG: amidohydrolase family protein [Bacteroidales bacterium]|nr:amidohydrolase family protein [Candidatus Equibacterium intestinale]